MTKRILLVGALIATSALSVQAQVITQWNFNRDAAGALPSITSPTASIGAGTASLFGGIAGSFSSGAANGGSSDPETAAPASAFGDNGWQTTTYGASTNAGNAGVQFMISTVGYTSAGFESFTVSYDLRHSNTSSRYEQVQYTVNNGTSWLNAGTYFDGNAGDTWFNGRSVVITDPLAFNNASFGLRITTSNGPGSALAASSTTYATSGTWRFDMVTLSATSAIPEPSSFAAIAGVLALAGVGSRRRRRA